VALLLEGLIWEYTTILNGTVASVELGRGMCAFLGLAYVFAHLGFVLLVPILLLAAAVLAVWQRVLRGRESVAAKVDNSGEMRRTPI
jgi:hypothetical protein